MPAGCRTRLEKQDLLDRSNPQNPVSFGLRIDSTISDRLFVAPFAGVEWVATDHFSVSIVPRLERPIGGSVGAGARRPAHRGLELVLL